jgi:hypothetical protein
MTVSVLVVGIVIVLCLGLVWLLPRAAPAEMDSDMASIAEAEPTVLRDGATV